MPQKWYYKTMIPIPGFIYKISFLKKWENLHHYLTFFERTLFRILLFAETRVCILIGPAGKWMLNYTYHTKQKVNFLQMETPNIRRNNKKVIAVTKV